jgi:type II secretory pathway pseudopilin PulG
VKTRRHSAAFTLVEVILAVGIVVGLLAVALFFYQQAARLRSELIVEAERLSSARLLLDRLTAELRAARPHSWYATPLVGEPGSIQFFTTSLPERSDWTGAPLGRAARPETDLKLVGYALALDPAGTNALGLVRTEEPLVELRAARGSAVTVPPADTGTNAPIALLTGEFRFLRFRYWDGATWVDSWNDIVLPGGVEITLAVDAPPDDSEATEPSEQPRDVFRRVVALPAATSTGARLGDLLNAASARAKKPSEFTETPRGLPMAHWNPQLRTMNFCLVRYKDSFGSGWGLEGSGQ